MCTFDIASHECKTNKLEGSGDEHRVNVDQPLESLGVIGASILVIWNEGG